MMIKINLLPAEVKKGQMPKMALRFKIPELGPRLIKAVTYSISILIGLHLFFGGLILLKSSSLSRLKSEWQRFKPNRIEIERLNSEIANVEKGVLPIKQLIKNRVSWARELNELSNLMTQGVWLTKLFIQTQITDVQEGKYSRILNIEGCAASLYGDEASLIARFVKNMREDKEFFQYFNDVKLGPMEKAVLDEMQVMNFKVYCLFKKRD